MIAKPMARPLAVLSNDDGVESEGLRILAERLEEYFELLVVAPAGERSAVSHAVTMDAEWVVHQRTPEEYAVEGTPADCVYLALCQLTPRPPAVVVSGVNRGFNLGTDVFYSGTVAAAAEAVVLGVPGIAVSAEARAGRDALDRAARFATALAVWVVERRWAPAQTLLNVNVPAEGGDGFGVGALGVRDYPRAPRRSEDPVSGERFRLERPRLHGLEGCRGEDAEIVRSGRISVTPLRMDWTHREESTRLAELQVAGFGGNGRPH